MMSLTQSRQPCCLLANVLIRGDGLFIPGTEMIHFTDTAAQLSTVVCSVCLELGTSIAPERPPIRLPAHKHVFRAKIFQSKIRLLRRIARYNRRSSFHIHIGLGRLLGIGFGRVLPLMHPMGLLLVLFFSHFLIILKPHFTKRKSTRVPEQLVIETCIGGKHWD